MHRSLYLITLITLSLFSAASAGNSCVAFDVNWNLLAFGFNGKDYDAGTRDSWSSGSAKDITKSGRPPFDNPNPTCYLSQFFNAIYILGANAAKPSSIYIYDAAAQSWSTQEVETNKFDPTSYGAVLDHDTNVFYALSRGELHSLDMGDLKAANSTPLAWSEVQNPQFGDSYQPVMALAQNHIHFINVPNVPAGSAKIFVIHFSFLQPDPQRYGDFPATHGQTTPFFKEQGVQQEFVFIPDDGSQTYVINVETNTTQTLKGPATKDPMATYFASTDSLVQLTSTGKVFFLPYSAGTTSANTEASWNAVSILPVAAASSGLPSGSTGTGSPTSTGNGAATSSGKPGGSNGSNSALSVSRSVGWSMGALIAFAIGAHFF